MASAGDSTDSGNRISSSDAHHPNLNSNNARATSPQAQILLQALQNYIVPLVNATNNQNNNVMHRNPWHSEAENFLTALEEFISSIILHSQSENQNGIEVDLQDNEDSGASYTALKPLNTISSPEVGWIDAPITAKSSEDNKRFIEQIIQLPTPLERILTALQKRIFNQMPIRLLHITPHGSKLQINLLERDKVYAYLAARVKAEYSEPLFHEKVASLETQKKLASWPGKPMTVEEHVIESWVSRYAKYAILSHTWIRAVGGEVTYHDWLKGALDDREPGYQKIVNFCKATWTHHGLILGWMDTICINKESSSELDESIRSMYKWYKDATVCITYLAGTVKLSKMHQDPWFTRGWTFQELLAPLNIHFYNTHWKRFGYSITDKYNEDICEQIRKATTITEYELTHPLVMPISRKMQLAAKRKVMREEDTAYSLMGICNVSISIAYGEGMQRAFFRLMTEILNSETTVLDVFNCVQDGYSSLIPSSPSAYLHRSTSIEQFNQQKPIEPLILTHLGLRIPVLLMPSVQEDHPNFKNKPIGDYYATAYFPPAWFRGLNYTGPFHLLDKGTGVALKEGVHYHTTFGILNFEGDKTTIKIPNTCLAVAFWVPENIEWESTSTSIRQHNTQEPIVFELGRKRKLQSHVNGYTIKQSKLAQHGMNLVTMYL